MDTMRSVLLHSSLVRLLLPLSSILIFISQCLAQTNSSFPAIFVFGDSTVDAGNNNFIPSLSKCNYPPYGKDFPNQIPTGRFSDGKLITDFIASHLGIKDSVPPFLDRSLNITEQMTGVCFASGGSGYDPLTAAVTTSISMDQQLINFGQYKWRLQAAIGNERAQDIIDRALYIVSCASNDIAGRASWVALPLLPVTSPFLIQGLMPHVQRFFQGLWNHGARRIAVFGVITIGCLPIEINAHAFLSPDRSCVDPVSTFATDFNQQLQSELKEMETRLTGTKFTYLDFYNPLFDMIHNPTKFGFQDVNRPCCTATMMFCNPLSLPCPDPSKFVFWDKAHPTEAAYRNAFMALQPTIDTLKNF